jgi:D-lyxose ketol-isomerase
MKRSDINGYIREGMEFFEKHGFRLPPFATFSLQDWKENRAQAREIFDLLLGWDITSFGTGDFLKTGLLLFTIRNGALNSKLYPKPYAEKIMMVREGQVTPRHFHWNKREDIINRGGGNLVMEVWKADRNDQLTNEPFEMSLDGIRRQFAAADTLVLEPGQSVCFEPYVAHRFYGQPGAGTVMVGEVSMVNDDANDNCFVDGQPRFDGIEEDECPLYLLASDYTSMVEAD